jgi:hypothetical protein
MLEDSQPPLPADDIAEPGAGGEKNGGTEDGKDRSDNSKDSNNNSSSASESARNVPGEDSGFAFMDLFSAR